MEYNFSIRRLLLLAGCLGLFAILGGFTPPKADRDRGVDPQRQRKAWTYCLVLFVAGSVAVSLIDHVTGTMDPTNLRPAYIVLGSVMMLAGALWLRSLKAETEPSATQSERRHENVALCVVL